MLTRGGFGKVDRGHAGVVENGQNGEISARRYTSPSVIVDQSGTGESMETGRL
jgi:hypothetical protein